MAMLVDTGSAVTLISKETYTDLTRSVASSSAQLTSVDTTLMTADGEAMKVYGETLVSLKVGDQEFAHSVIVAELGGFPGGILGLDFLAQQGILIDTDPVWEK